MATWNDVTWDSGQVVAKTKMNYLTGNTEYIKNEGPEMLSIFAGDSIAREGGTGDLTINIYVGSSAGTGGTLLDTYIFTEGDGFHEDFTTISEDISGESNGLLVLTFEYDNDNVTNPPQDRSYRFVKTQNMNYLSVWATAFSNSSSNNHGMHSVFVITHPNVETW